MLTSSANQYLRPDYLTPLPTTLDAKKSPLALLAQTCSQIGADPPTTKSLLAPAEKSNKSKSNETREKSSPHNGTVEQIKSSFKPYESCLSRDKASSPEEQQRAPSSHSTSGRSRTPGSNGKRCSSNQSASSTRAVTPQGRKTATPNNNEQTTRESPVSRTSNASNTTTTTSTTATTNETSTNQASRGSPQQSKSVYNSMNSDSGMKEHQLGAYKPSTTIPSSVASSGYLGYPHQLPIDVMANSIMSQHHAAMKNANGKIPISSASSSSTTTTSSCPAGCVQCDHKTSIANPYGQMGAHTMATSAAAYAHAQLAALAAASQLPYVCNWIAGDTAYCGKRFSSSDELLQHLRSHTSVSGDPNATAAALSMLPGLPPTHPLLSRSYPTPPLSPLATARYHPYGKPSPLFPHSLSSLGLGLPSHPHSAAAAAAAAAGLSPYFSPYSLYGGPRLGATSGMHP
ncbi:zinc finger protein Elbow-like isoform X2 [Aphidius gifuensis]|uniref:zinc finger protein Elbow-like isoform X2 n=1 Tax=Aphidius gifuensis TaxID=684658 RepID=UPI001CDC10F2|nr:zinc finger protein Elbow-like isoform X2 [Aphidius gifuensis]